MPKTYTYSIMYLSVSKFFHSRSIAPDMRYAVLCSVMAEGNKSDYDFLMKQYKKTHGNASYKYEYLKSLFCYQKPEILQLYVAIFWHFIYFETYLSYTYKHVIFIKLQLIIKHFRKGAHIWAFTWCTTYVDSSFRNVLWIWGYFHNFRRSLVRNSIKVRTKNCITVNLYVDWISVDLRTLIVSQIICFLPQSSSHFSDLYVYFQSLSENVWFSLQEIIRGHMYYLIFAVHLRLRLI